MRKQRMTRFSVEVILSSNESFTPEPGHGIAIVESDVSFICQVKIHRETRKKTHCFVHRLILRVFIQKWANPNDYRKKIGEWKHRTKKDKEKNSLKVPVNTGLVCETLGILPQSSFRFEVDDRSYKLFPCDLMILVLREEKVLCLANFFLGQLNKDKSR